MDLSFIHFLFSVVFVLIGSLAFHIAALVSGENIYRDLPTLEATLLSTVAGIVIFSLSPISFIILQPSKTSTNILVQILDCWVLLAFFGGAVGFGLFFGCVIRLRAGVNILKWFRHKTGMRFGIFSYSITWDEFLNSVKSRGEVFVQTDKDMFKGLLGAHSIKDEQREIYLEKAKIKEYRRVKDIAGEKDVGLLILGSEIKRIIVPERSFKKHYESMGHIAQAFYIQILAIGFFFLEAVPQLSNNDR